jgi:hypothetical protein
VVGYNLVVQTGGMTFTEQITKIYSPTVVFEDDMNTSGSFATKYVATGSWGYQATNGMLSTASLTESPAGNYANSADNFIKLANPLNLSSCTQAYLEFMIKYNSENCMDRMQLEISTTGVNGAYTPICTNNTMSESKGSLTGNPVYTGLTDGWIREIVNLSSYIGNNNVGLRLHFLSNGTNSVAYTNLRDGFNLDNIQVIKTNAISLPVTFEDINAVREGDKIRVNWKAHFDTHFGRYEIQRSGNGVDFYTIGTESDPNTSTFLDKTPLHGYNYYRIKAYDLDESYKASKIVSLVFENSAQFTVYPNPVNNVMNVEIVSESGGKRGIVIIDMSGQVVEKKDVVVKQGYNVHQLEVSKLASQTYVVQLRDESGVVLKTIKVLKR